MVHREGVLKKPRDLTPEEARWVNRLRKVLASCPPTLELLTGGDRGVQVIDREMADEVIDGGVATLRGANLASVPAACRVHGVAW